MKNNEKIIGLIIETEDSIKFLSEDKEVLNRIEEEIELELMIKSKPEFEKKIKELLLKQSEAEENDK